MNSVTLFQMLGDIDRWGIDIFRIGELSNHRPLTAVAYAAFQVKEYFNAVAEIWELCCV